MTASNIQNFQQSPRRPNNGARLSANRFNEQLQKEQTQAVHSIKLFCRKNSLWLVPLGFTILIFFAVDLYTIFIVWKNPAVLFEQLKIFAGWVIVYILGLVTDYVRQKITSYN